MGAFRQFTDGISFNVDHKTRSELDRLSLEERKSVSEILRKIIEDYLSKESKTKTTTGDNKCNQK